MFQSTINRKSLLAALVMVSRVTRRARTRTLPILQSVHIEAMEGELRLSATDLETSYHVLIPEAVVEGEGVAIVDCKQLAAIVRAGKSDTVGLHLDGETFEVLLGDHRSILASSPAEEYPTLPDINGDMHPVSSVDCDALADALGGIVHAVSTDETRYNLNAVYFEPGEASEFTTTDGHRMAHTVSTITLEKGEGVMIPAAAVGDILAACKKSKGQTVAVWFEGARMVLQTASWGITVRLIEGEYVNYRQVIPKSGLDCVQIDRRAFVDSLRAVIAGSDTKKNEPVFCKLVVNGSLEIHTGDTLATTLKIESTLTDAIKFSFNARYLAEALESLSGKCVHFGFNPEKDPSLSPVTLDSVDDPGESVRVVMPIRV